MTKEIAYANANCWLNVTIESRTIPLCTEPTYLDVQLDRTLLFRGHLESLCRKLTLRVGLAAITPLMVSRFALLRREAQTADGLQ